MTFQNRHNTFNFSVRAKARDLAIVYVPCWSRITIFVVLCQLRECQSRSIERAFAAFFYFTQKLFDQLSSMSSGESAALDVAAFAVFVNVGNAGEYLPVLILPDRSASRASHDSTKNVHKQGGRDASTCGSLKQGLWRGLPPRTRFIFNRDASCGEGQRKATEGGNTLLTSGSQVRVLLGSYLSRKKFHKSYPQSRWRRG